MGAEDSTAHSLSFKPVPLPSLAPGELTAGRLDPVLREWVSSAPIRALAEASGWSWPTVRDTGELLRRLAGLSADWDFRARGGGVERNFIGVEPTVINGLEVPEELIVSAAQALGLVNGTPVPKERFTSLVVLSGLVRACVNRTRHAAALLSGEVQAASVTVLAGHRELGGDEPVLAKEQGFGEQFDEADVVLAATRQAFGLSEASETWQSEPRRAAWSDELWTASAQYHWPGVEVLIVPSAQVGKRVNTPGQLRYWADRVGIGRDDRVLLLTTQIYVPYQQLVGLQTLGLERGCQVYCCGVDSAHSFLPARSFGGRSYLQEIRSALCAAAELVTTAERSSAYQPQLPQLPTLGGSTADRDQQFVWAALVDAQSGLRRQVGGPTEMQLNSSAQRTPSSVTAQGSRPIPPPALKLWAKNERSSPGRGGWAAGRRALGSTPAARRCPRSPRCRRPSGQLGSDRGRRRGDRAQARVRA